MKVDEKRGQAIMEELLAEEEEELLRTQKQRSRKREHVTGQHKRACFSCRRGAWSSSH